MTDENFNERTKKAFDFYADSTKQLITLSTAIIAVTITFAKDILGALPGFAKLSLMIALICYLVSVFFGLGTLLSLTGALQPYKFMKALRAQESSPPASPPSLPFEGWPIPSIYDRKIINPSRTQVILFAVATGLVVITGIIVALPVKDKSDDKKALKDLESQWSEAYKQGDVELLGRIVSDDYVSTNAVGRIFNRKDFLNDVAVNSMIESLDSTEIKVSIYGETAIVTGIYRQKLKTERESQIDLLRYVHVYMKQQERWRMIAAQQTLLKNDHM